jgi:hypothetical protein
MMLIGKAYDEMAIHRVPAAFKRGVDWQPIAG